MQSLFFAFLYDDARAAIAWLERAFGAIPVVVYDGPDGDVAHAELRLEGDTFMLGSRRERAVRADGCYVTLADAAAVDAMCERARRAGATIVREPHDTEYGSHDFSARDVGGNEWGFGTYRPGGDH